MDLKMTWLKVGEGDIQSKMAKKVYASDGHGNNA
jgi:hypothetical protein